MIAERNGSKDCAHLDHIENYTQKTLVKSNNLGADSASSFIEDSYSEKHGGTTILYEEKTSATAWIETLVCMGVSTSCAFMWTTCSGAPNIMSKWMEVSLTKINWLSNASAICNTAISLLTAWAYERFGIKASIIACAVLNTIGCWVRCIAILVPLEKRYALVMLGQFIASIGGPLIYNLAAKFVAVWFAPKDRGIANTILSVQLGMALAPLLLPMLTPTVEDVPKTLIIVAGISTFFTIPTFFIPSKPKVPPSSTATMERTPFWQGVRELSSNIQFWWIAIITAVSMGMVFSVSVLIIEAISPFGYTEQQAGFCAAVIVLSGCFGGGMTGYWLGKSPQHFMFIKLFTPLVVFSYVVFIFQLIPNAFSVVLIACIFNGFFSYALFPVYLELASEVTYPVSESISSCILWTLSSLTMVIFSLVIDALRAGPDASPPNNMNTSMIVVAVIMFVGNLPCLWIKGDLKRSKVDNENRAKLASVV